LNWAEGGAWALLPSVIGTVVTTIPAPASPDIAKDPANSEAMRGSRRIFDFSRTFDFINKGDLLQTIIWF
jgi:hypothetical protein